MGKVKLSERQTRRQIAKVVAMEISTLQSSTEISSGRISENCCSTIQQNRCTENLETEMDHDCGPHVILDEDFDDRNTNSDTCSYNTDDDVERNYHDDDNEDVPELLSKQLQNWAIQENISNRAVDRLLHILSGYHPELPKTSKTLLKTPLSSNVTECSTGDLLYLGLKNGILSKIKSGLRPGISSISLQFNIDGLPPFNSSNLSLWPILATVNECLDVSPFAIQIYLGYSKPKSLDLFFEKFISEFAVVLEEGLQTGEQILSINKSKCLFVCDAPARAFIKGIKGHSGYFGCEKCVTEGMWRNKVVFPNFDEEIRTDESFKSRTQEEHHLYPYNSKPSPLETIGIGMCNQIPLEYMHLICLGIVKKLIHLWTKGPKKTRLSGNEVKLISDGLQKCRSYIPSDFQRKPRDLEVFTRWKATECRLFLIYLGPALLKNILRREVYCNFMLLSIGVRILLGNNSKLYPTGGKILKHFVEHYRDLYGTEHVVYNVHNVIHLADEAIRHGSLDTFSAFRFESYLGKLKSKLRSGNKPLQQLHRRIVEEENCSSTQHLHKPFLSIPNSSGPVFPDYYNDSFLKYKKCVTSRFILSTSNRDCYCKTKSGEIIQIVNFIQTGLGISVICKKIAKLDNLFDYPISSHVLGIHVAKLASFKLLCIELDAISAKLFAIPDKNSALVLLPICHTV